MLGGNLIKNVRKKDKKSSNDSTTFCFLITKSFIECNHWVTSLILGFMLTLFLCHLSNLLIVQKCIVYRFKKN